MWSGLELGCASRPSVRKMWNPELNLWLSLASASATKVESSSGLCPPCPAFLFSKCLSHCPPPLSVWVSLPVTRDHHQPPAPHHEHGVSFSEYGSPIIKNMPFLDFLQVSPPSICFQIYHCIRCALPTPCCFYHLPGRQNTLLSSTSSPKSL